MKFRVALSLLLLMGAEGLVSSAPPPNTPENNPKAPAPAVLVPPQVPTGHILLVGALKKTGQAPTLIGRSGDLYEPAGPLSWKRTNGGGVSANVESVHRDNSGTLYAQGSRAPLFRNDSGIWSANPLANRGSSTFSLGSRSVITAGRHIYLLDAKGWRRVASARAVIKAIWAKSPNRFFVATSDGKLYVGGKAGWKLLRITLGESEEITTLIGTGDQVVALTNRQRLFTIPPAGFARQISQAGFAKLEIHKLGVVKGKIVAAGVAGKSERNSLLLQVGGKSLTKVDTLWRLTDEDRFAVLIEHGQDQLIVASKTGQIRVRKTDGTWQNALVNTALPTPASSYVGSAPALSH